MFNTSTSLVIFYELQIYGFLGVASLLFYFIARDQRHATTWLGKRKKTSLVILSIIACAWLVVFYGSFIEPEIITITKSEITINNGPDKPITIALISDHHVGPYTKAGFMKRVVKKIIAQKPDLVLMAGDYVTSYDRPDDIKLLSPLRTLAQTIPTYAVLGNHDEGIGETPDLTLMPEWAETMERALSSLGIHVLRNASKNISIQDQDILLIGLDDIPEPIGATKKILLNEIHDKPWIAMAHHPEYVIDAAPYGIDLYFAGHTHGGQIRLPFFGPVPNLPTVLGQKYDHGLRFWGNVPMWITRGLGVSSVRARLFSPPEIALITIK